MATTTAKEAGMGQANGNTPATKAIEANVKEVKEAAAPATKAIEANVKEVKAAAAPVTRAIEANVKGVKEATAKAGNAIEANVKEAKEATAKAGNAVAVWLRKLPLASLGLVAVIGDETKEFVNKLFMNKLVERGELVQKDAEKWMKDVQARFR